MILSDKAPGAARGSLAVASLAGLLFSLNCGGDSPPSSQVSAGNAAGTSAGPGPCKQTLSCGAACATDAECASGQYCGGKQLCTADCVAGDASCASGSSCTARGRCQAGGMLDVTGIDVGGTGGTGVTACVDTDVNFEKQIPNVVLLVDQSGSMKEAFGANNRWDTLRSALMDPATGIVKTLEADVNFGLDLYTSVHGNQGGACPMLTTVPLANLNYAAINAVYSKTNYQEPGDTPTGESVAAVAAKLALLNDPGQKVIVLATDGDPDSCANPDAHNAASKQLSIDAASDAFGKGIFTFVISVGNDVALTHLQDVANAGQGVPVGGAVNTKYYVANSQAQLKEAFDTIINGVRSCVLDLNGSVSKGSEGKGTVTLDGAPLALGDANGWRLNAPNLIELVGEACTKIKTGDHDVKILFPCGVFEPK